MFSAGATGRYLNRAPGSPRCQGSSLQPWQLSSLSRTTFFAFSPSGPCPGASWGLCLQFPDGCGWSTFSCPWPTGGPLWSSLLPTSSKDCLPFLIDCFSSLYILSKTLPVMPVAKKFCKTVAHLSTLFTVS